jgi:hypothetical protein
MIASNCAATTLRPALSLAPGLLLLIGCSQSPPPGVATAAPANSPAALLGAPKAPTPPKVPANNQPCAVLSLDDLKGLGISGATPRPDRAPANLPYDNLCFIGGVHYGFMALIDYETNQTSNRNTSKAAPADLPGSFYDRQGGLWFAKGGYYVNVASNGVAPAKLASALAAKL